MARGVGGTAVFGEQLVFAHEVHFWNGQHVQYFLIKAKHYPKILGRGKQDCWLTPGFLAEGEGEGGEGGKGVKLHADHTTDLGGAGAGAGAGGGACGRACCRLGTVA